MGVLEGGSLFFSNLNYIVCLDQRSLSVKLKVKEVSSPHRIAVPVDRRDMALDLI